MKNYESARTNDLPSTFDIHKEGALIEKKQKTKKQSLVIVHTFDQTVQQMQLYQWCCMQIQ
jgi:hypothetical protein